MGVLVGRTLTLQLLTIGVTIVLARILSPEDYGLFALALAVQIAGQRITELGLPSALVQRADDPEPETQRAVNGVLLALSVCVLGLFALVGLLLFPVLGIDSRSGQTIVVACLAIPAYANRAMPMVLLERHLGFGRIAIVETVETIAFNAFSLVAAIGGLGAFSLAGAVPAAAVLGLLAAHRVQPTTRRPSLNLGPVRPLIGFGIRLGGAQAVGIAKELGFVGMISLLGGAPAAGFYAMARRLFSFPVALTSAVARVAFPTLTRDQEQRPRRAARMMVITATVAALPLALVAGAAQPLINVILGPEWLPAADVVISASLGMMVVASASAIMVGNVLARGTPGLLLRATIVEAFTLLAIALVLYDRYEMVAVGVAISASSILSALVLAGGSEVAIRRSLLTVARITLVTSVAVVAGQIVQSGDGFAALAGSMAAVAVTWIAIELILFRPELMDLVRLSRRAMPRRLA